MPDNRAKYIATVLQAVILGAVTYYGVKWLVDAMDPTKKSRLAAQKQVGTSCVIICMHEAGSYFHKVMKRKRHFNNAGPFINMRLNASMNDLSETP